MKSPAIRALAIAAAALGASGVQAQEKFTFLTNWYAQAEHGGFYQALATGLYKKEGLDVTIKMGGPQVNGMQLLAAGQTDCFMGYDSQTIKAWENGVNAVTVAAAFQKDPQVLIGHPGVVNKMEDLKGKTILISSAANTTYWPWLMATYKLDASQARPYTFNIQPFVADKNLVQQGYLSSEPYAIEKEAKFKPNVFLLSDYGWPPYSTTIVCMEDTVKKNPKAVAAFVKASMQGWKDYLKGDPSAGQRHDQEGQPEHDRRQDRGGHQADERNRHGRRRRCRQDGHRHRHRRAHEEDLRHDGGDEAARPGQGRPEEDLHHRVRQGPEDLALTPRSACGAPPRGRRQRPGKAGSAAAA